MKAMILAAGEGRRLRPLTRTTPKPLLRIGDQSLIERHVERLVSAGFTAIVINLFHLADQFELVLGDGQDLGAEITYVKEPGLLETGGGITNALDCLGNGARESENFVVVSGDIYTDYEFEKLPRALPTSALGHLVMVDNPEHHPAGDFAVDREGSLVHDGNRLTYSGISVLSMRLFSGCQVTRFPLRKLLDQAISSRQLTGEHYAGFWADVGTPERYEWLQAEKG